MGSVLKMDNAANDFLNTLDSVISEKLKRIDDTILCRVKQINDDGSVDVIVEPDENNLVTGVGNILMGELQKDDYVWVYRVGQNFTNSFIIYKLGYNVDVNNFKNTIQTVTYNSGGGGGQSNITIETGDENGQIKVINGTYVYNVDVKGLKANAYTDTQIPTVYLVNASYENNILTITPHNGATITIPIPAGGNFVTLDTAQTITGAKTFTQPIVSTSEIAFTFANKGAMKVEDSAAYLQFGSGEWEKLDVCHTYDFTSTPSQTWNIAHNMNKFPQVTIVRVYIDSSEQQIVKTEEIIAAVEYIDFNNLVVNFESEIKGYAYLS